GEKDDDDGAGRRRERDLAEMKAQRRCGVEEAVAVMDLMEAPEERQAMVGPMPPVDEEIEQQQIGKDPLRAGEPWWPQTERQPCGRPRTGNDYGKRKRGAEGGEGEIAGWAPPTARPAPRKRGCRPQPLGQKQEAEPCAGCNPLPSQKSIAE